MKRRYFLKHLTKHKCVLRREGAKHSIYEHLETEAHSTIPRHREINNITVKSICRDLQIPIPKKF